MRLATRKALLTAAGELALARRIHGDNEADARIARNLLVTHNLGLIGQAVGWFRARHRHRAVDWDDLFSAGSMGLIRAAMLYKPWDQHAGIRFSSYATHAIRNEIRDFLHQDRAVTVPLYLTQSKVRYKLATAHARTPGRRANLERNLARARAALGRTLSLSATPDPDQDGPNPSITPLDAAPPALDRVIQDEDTARMIAALGLLQPIPCYVLIHRYGLAGADVKTLRELGEELDLTRERVRQIERQAIARLRRLLDAGTGRACA